MGIITTLQKIWTTRNSDVYIGSLRKQGIIIGENVLFRSPSTTLIDVSRPAFVKIGNNVDINRHFQILTHDWGSYVIRGKYHDFINSGGGGNNW